MARFDRDSRQRGFDSDADQPRGRQSGGRQDESGWRAEGRPPGKDAGGRTDESGYGGMPSDRWGREQSEYRSFGFSEQQSSGGRTREEFPGYPQGRPSGRSAFGSDFNQEFPSMNNSPRRGNYRDFEDHSFRQQTTRASELMTENPETVTGDTPISTVAKKMKDLDVGIIPVIDSDDSRRLRGVITDRDIAIRAVAQGMGPDTAASECMTERVRSVNKNDAVSEVMRVMGEEQVRRVPVTDREGRLVGIIAQADLAVDFAHNSRGREHAVSETIERISSPAHPERGYTEPGRWNGEPGSWAANGRMDDGYGR